MNERYCRGCGKEHPKREFRQIRSRDGITTYARRCIPCEIKFNARSKLRKAQKDYEDQMARVKCEEIRQDYRLGKQQSWMKD